MARSIDVPVVSVSAAMGLVTVYRGDARHVLQDERRLHERVRQALQTSRRFRQRFDTALGLAVGRSRSPTPSPCATSPRCSSPPSCCSGSRTRSRSTSVELGEDGRLLRLQLEEVLEGVDPVRQLVVRDYLFAGDGGRTTRADGRQTGAATAAAPATTGAVPTATAGASAHIRRVRRALAALAALSTDELLDVRRVPGVLGLGSGGTPIPTLAARAPRLPAVAPPPRFPEPLVDRIVEHFAGLQRIMRASVGDLEEVEGVGEARARSVKEGLARLAEASILDRYELTVGCHVGGTGRAGAPGAPLG